jgi:formamidase
MFPELAREAAYKGANVYIRISGYSTQVNDQWIWTNKTNAWQNLMYTISVNLAGYDGVFYYFGEGTVCNYDGNVIQQGQRNPWEIVTAELFPRLVDKARENWALENNIYNVGCRAYVGKPGGEKENYLTWVKDLSEGNYKLPLGRQDQNQRWMEVLSRRREAWAHAKRRGLNRFLSFRVGSNSCRVYTMEPTLI